MRRILTFGGYFEAFIATLSEDVVRKIDYGLALLKTQERVPAKSSNTLRTVFLS